MSTDKLIGVGLSAVVLRISPNQVIKRAHPGSHDAIEHERRVLDRLRNCPFVLKHFDKEQDGEIILESHKGDLRRILESGEPIPTRKIALQVVEGLSCVHSRGVIHCDLSTTNVLVTTKMDVAICDFAASSIDGYRPPSSSIVEIRFCRPHHKSEDCTTQDDLFALGSLLYELATGFPPYRDLEDNEVAKRYYVGTFPGVDHLVTGNVIAKCWSGEYKNIDQVRDDIARCLLPERNDTLFSWIYEWLRMTTSYVLGSTEVGGDKKRRPS